MNDTNLFAQQGRGLEEEYFREKEEELIEKLRRHPARQSAQGEWSEQTGIMDDDILETLHELGFTRNTVSLLHLVPLIQVGWASGKVTRKERELMLEAANLRAVKAGSAAYNQLVDWIDNRPGEEFFEKTLRVIGDILQHAPEIDRARSRHGLFTQCIRVASASGGILGIGNRISDEELALLERIAQVIGQQPESSDSSAPMEP